MKLYIYKGFDEEEVPDGVTHVIVDDSVTIIKEMAFYPATCMDIVSIVMGDNVKRIEGSAFDGCNALQFIRLSRTLEFIGENAFRYCESLEALFLPSTVKSIGNAAFECCASLRLLVLPNDIDLNSGGEGIIWNTYIHHFGMSPNLPYVAYSYDENNREVNEWLIHHLDEAPFHKLCCDPFITTKVLNDYTKNSNDSLLAIDTILHDMTPLHMLSMNPHAPADTVAALFNVNIEVAFHLDGQVKVPLDYARDNNVCGLVAMVNGLCNHRHGA